MTTDLNLDDLDIQPDETDDDYARINRKHLDGLREAAKGASKSRKEAEDLRKQIAFSDAGLADLSEARRNALLATVKDVTPEALIAQAVDLGFREAPEPPAPEVDAAEIAEQEAHAAAVNGGGAPKPDQLTAADTAGWDAEKRQRFTTTHPDLAMALLRGESVKAPAGFSA